MGTYEKGERTKVELLHAARTLFAQRGYNATTIADIARSADVRPGLVHYHYDAKISIASAIQAELLHGFIDFVAERCPDSNALARRTTETLLFWKLIGASDSYARFLYETLPQGLMTGMPEVTFVRQAREAGVDSFVYKVVGTGELLDVMRSTMEGRSTWPDAPSGLSGVLAALTDEEMRILQLTCETKTRRQIARELYVSEGTVKRHVTDILAKTGYSSILRLAVDVVKDGYIVPELTDHEPLA